MNKRLLLASVAGVLAMAMVATPAYAQRGGRGGGGWGGGRGYGGSYGGYNHEYYGGNGDYNHGYYGGYGNGWYGRGYGVGIGLGFGYPYYGGGYYNNGYASDGYAPGYYGSPDNYAYGTYANVQPGAAVNPRLSNYQVQMNSEPTGNSVAMQSFYSGPSANAGRADLTIKVPADAQVWLNTMQSSQTGTERHFGFPALPGGDNMFTVRGTWNDNGQTVTRDRQVNMKAGANTTIDLTQNTTDNAAPSNPNAGQTTPNNTANGPKPIPPIRPDTGTKQ